MIQITDSIIGKLCTAYRRLCVILYERNFVSYERHGR